MPRLARSEFDEDEDPRSSGTHVYLELAEHFGEVLLACVLLQRMTQLGLALLGLELISRSEPGPEDEWIEDEVPPCGFPDLRTEYDLPHLESRLISDYFGSGLVDHRER